MLKLTADDFADVALDPQAGGRAIWSPFPNSPQSRAYACNADVIGFGGQAGGGKTDLGLGKAFTHFYKSIFFRREYTQLKDVIVRGDTIQDGRCAFVSGEKKRWLTPDGRTVELGAVEHEGDRFKFKGRPHDFIIFDEAADFTETIIRFIMGWLRTERPEIKPQVLMCFNPPTTPEGEWIVNYFAPWLSPDYIGERAKSGELRYFIRDANDKDVEVESAEPITIDGATYTPQSRTFFPASVEDNPVYMATGYDKQLESLPEPLRSQLRYGDFAATAVDDIWQTIPTAWIIEAQNRHQKQQKPDLALRGMGVDPSRGGQDETTIAKLYGTWFAPVIAHPGQSVPDGIVAAKLVTDALGDEKAIIAIDVIGIGASVYDHLKVLQGVDARAVNVAASSNARDKSGRYGFANLRSEMVWKFREALDPSNGENIALPLDTQLRNDLRAPKFSIVGGKIKVESKVDIKARIGRSPDRGDAVLLAWHITSKPSGASYIAFIEID